jgi:hypothetical protein
MITLHLSREDADLLRSELARRAEHVERELVRTDAPAMQHELARDLEHIEALLHLIDGQIASSDGLPQPRAPRPRAGL